MYRATKPITSLVFRVNVEGDRNDDVCAKTHASLEVVALAVLDEVVDHEHTEEEDHSLEALEVERHVLSDDPADNDHERSHEQHDLDGAADRNTDGQVHLVLVGDDHGRNVLGGVTNDGQEDETDEGLADARRFDDGIYAIDEVLGADGDQDRNQNQGDGCCDGAEDLSVFALLIAVTLLVLGVEEPGVGLELEDEVEDVEDEHDDRGTAREGQNVGHRFAAVVVGGAVDRAV